MPDQVPWLLLLIAAIASYFQTVTGFGLGIIMMALVGLLGIAPLTVITAVISLMTLVNCLVALPGRLHHVYWPSVRVSILAMVPAIMLGVTLLNYLSSSATTLMRILLGLVILYVAIGMLIKPKVQAQMGGQAGFALFGGLSGFLGGLFGMAGPPLVYHYYRQPLEPVRIRNTLILLFAATSGGRTLFVVSQGQMSLQILELTAWVFPVTALATWAGRRWPPPLSAQGMRRVVFALLFAIGLSLVAGGLWD